MKKRLKIALLAVGGLLIVISALTGSLIVLRVVKDTLKLKDYYERPDEEFQETKQQNVEFSMVPCNEEKGLKESSIELETTENSVEFTQVLNTYCNTNKENLTIVYEKDNFNIKVREIFNADTITRCICSFDISGKIPNLEEGIYTIQFVFDNKTLNQEEPLGVFDITVGQNNGLKRDFCGISTEGWCNRDTDCTTSGCSKQICQSKHEKPFVSTCEWHECYNAERYGVECKCIENKCVWR